MSTALKLETAQEYLAVINSVMENGTNSMKLRVNYLTLKDKLQKILIAVILWELIYWGG